MVKDLSFRLTKASHCSTGPGEYFAKAFVATPVRTVIRKQLHLGSKHLTTGVEDWTGKVLGMLPMAERHQLVGINYLKLCGAKVHGGRLVLERVAAIAFVSPTALQYDIEPSSLVTEDGVGKVMHALPNQLKFHPVVDFATLPKEDLHHPATRLVEAAAATPQNPAFIALRGLETVHIGLAT